ncbi:hypothetical protein [Rhizobium sp. 11515TR]|uniref:hypothetical protein n=1 Tax=Rhizobium sp. 11515TR TaxID=2028343 RepID=UPI000BA86E58|nr:hypothetical protein [Rhizobium sp. 11515TR]ASW10193.1 hypothetical protein CKA34_29910 [Rhizobium sp. 11515TR]
MTTQIPVQITTPSSVDIRIGKLEFYAAEPWFDQSWKLEDFVEVKLPEPTLSQSSNGDRS